MSYEKTQREGETEGERGKVVKVVGESERFGSPHPRLLLRERVSELGVHSDPHRYRHRIAGELSPSVLSDGDDSLLPAEDVGVLLAGELLQGGDRNGAGRAEKL